LIMLIETALNQEKKPKQPEEEAVQPNPQMFMNDAL
jgi:hypothetical protein